MLDQDFLSQYPPTTRSTYAQIFDDFRSRIGVEPQNATHEHMAAYRKALNGQASATVHKKLAGLSSFMHYLGLRGVRSDNPMVAIRKPKVDHLRSIVYLTTEQVQQLMDSFDDTKKSVRDRALISVFLHGLRIAEVVNLNVEDYREGNLWVTGKGDKTRIVPLSQQGQTNLEAYLGRRRTGPLFLSVYRHGDRIERRALRNIVYAATERIGARMSPHKLRHTCGTLMMRATGNLAAVQEVLGHANPATTRVYAHLDVSDLRRAVEQSALLGENRELHILEGVG
jgi:site-specific recombinase XerC